MKLSESHLLEFRLELEQLITEREGALAFNQTRAIDTEHGIATPVGYDHGYFEGIASQIKGIRDRMTYLLEH